MPPSTRLLKRKPTQTKIVMSIFSIALAIVAGTVSGPVGVAAGILSGALFGGALVKRPGD